MKWFGIDSWGAPVCKPEDHVSMPDAPCAVCGEQFEYGDRGLVLPFVGGPGDPPELPYHHRCFARCIGVDTEGS